MKKDETSVRVRYKDTDQMGVAYYANYLIWFEVGRTELMRSLELPYREFEKSNIYLPVLKVYCEYKQPARYDDQLAIVTRLESLHNVRVVFNYEIRRENEVLATGYTEHAFVKSNGRPVVLKKFSPFLWNRLCQALEEKQQQ